MEVFWHIAFDAGARSQAEACVALLGVFSEGIAGRKLPVL